MPVTVALKQDAQAVNREPFVDILNEAGVLRNQSRQATGRNDSWVNTGITLSQLGKNSFQNSINQSDVAEVEAALQMAHGVRSNHFCRPLDVHTAQARGAIEQRIGTEAKAGRNSAAKVLAPWRDHFEFGSCTEVHHDAGAAIAFIGSDRIREPVR